MSAERERKLVACKTHRKNEVGWCLSCRIAIDWNTWRQFCHCGVPAVGYVARTASVAEAAFYCDEHWSEHSTAPPEASLAGAAPHEGEK